jgi:hypothetical protein
LKEKGQGGPESAPNSQREGTPPQEHGRPQEWSHEALVKRYQNIVQKNLSKLGKYYSAEEIIRIEIERDIFAAEKNSEACNGGELAFYGSGALTLSSRANGMLTGCLRNQDSTPGN